MRAKKPGRILSLLLSAVMLLALLPAVSGNAAAAEPTEQFNIPVGKTYYFDLSSEAGNIGAINTDLPDKTLKYVPFTYAGTVNAYSLESSSSGNPAASTSATKSNRSLFVADYTISHTISWNALNAKELIFGKTFKTNYKLRSLSGGNSKTGSAPGGSDNVGVPNNNEWDSILRKSGLTNTFHNVFPGSWAQDTSTNQTNARTARGGDSAACYEYIVAHNENICYGFRPALEVINGTGLKAIEFNLNGGCLAMDANAKSMCFAYTGDSYTMPNIELTRPSTDSTGTYFKWNTKANGHGQSYEANAPVPDTVKTLYAQWSEPIPYGPATLGVAYDVANTGTGSRLERSLKEVVTDPTAGITAADKADGNNVTLKLTVAEKTTVTTPESEQIEGVKQGDIVQYYDVKVEKTVTPADGSPATTVLTSIPKPVQAVIPVPSAIQGKTSYTVYRIHGGVAQKIPNDPTAAEFYTVNPGGTSLTLHVSKFSTYAVITGGKSLTGDVTFGDAKNPKTSDMDVQGKVLEGMFGVYKLDISWGAMKFDYNSKGMVWNAETHAYVATPGSEGWTKESFVDPNNKITVANHSNGDVTLYYAAKLEAVLTGATMTVRTTNSLQGVLAENLLLAKVPTETAAAPTVDAYVWLDGNPTNLTSKTYTKAGVITITAEPDTAGGLTPKTTP